MKLISLFSVIKNALSDIRAMHDFYYITPAETRDEFWEKECDLSPTKLTCKIYEV